MNYFYDVADPDQSNNVVRPRKKIARTTLILIMLSSPTETNAVAATIEPAHILKAGEAPIKPEYAILNADILYICTSNSTLKRTMYHVGFAVKWNILCRLMMIMARLWLLYTSNIYTRHTRVMNHVWTCNNR